MRSISHAIAARVALPKVHRLFGLILGQRAYIACDMDFTMYFLYLSYAYSSALHWSGAILLEF